MSVKKHHGDGSRTETPEKERKDMLAIVLKADTKGTVEAIVSGLEALRPDEVILRVIHTGTGNVSKSDLHMAETGSRLVLEVLDLESSNPRR